jgi:Fe-S cluster biogenesis protein NfuA/nitrite reductase/ring-hydroxylating ferredoxin subunit
MTTTSPAPAMAPDLDKAARRVDTAMERVGLLDEASRRVADDLKAAVEEFHREGITRIVKALKGDPRGKELLFELVDDPVVYALFAMHGIVRADATTLAQRALEEVRPYLESHGGGVTLVDVELPTVRVRLSGTCNGCSSSSTTLREVVERALVANVPGAHEVVVVPTEPEPTLVPLTSIGLRTGAAPAAPAGTQDPAAGWTRGPALADVRDGRVTVWRPDGLAETEPGVAFVRIGDAVSAFRDVCAHQGLSLERGMVDAEGCVLTCPWHGLKYQALTGESISMIDKRLTAYPSRVDDGVLWVRLGR